MHGNVRQRTYTFAIFSRAPREVKLDRRIFSRTAEVNLYHTTGRGENRSIDSGLSFSDPYALQRRGEKSEHSMPLRA